MIMVTLPLDLKERVCWADLAMKYTAAKTVGDGSEYGEAVTDAV
jgi:hypothetical protein